jgi:hypothetical protein
VTLDDRPAHVALGDEEIGMHQPITVTLALAVVLTGLAFPEAAASVATVPVRIIHVSGANGFDWGDAGIGAAAGAGITLLGLGGALAVTQRHTHPTTGPRRPGTDPGSPPGASQPTHQHREVP